MARLRQLTRRSFLAQVVGGAAIGTAAFAQNEATPAEPQRMIVDADPKDPAREVPTPRPFTFGAIGGRPPPPAQGHGDSDTGSAADAAGSGRSAGRPVSRFVFCPGNPRCPPRRP